MGREPPPAIYSEPQVAPASLVVEPTAPNERWILGFAVASARVRLGAISLGIGFYPFLQVIGPRISQPESSLLGVRTCYLLRAALIVAAPVRNRKVGYPKPGSNPRQRLPNEAPTQRVWDRSGLLASVEIEGESRLRS